MPALTDLEAAQFEQLRARLTAISCRILDSRADAEDIVQDCFIKWHGAERAAVLTPAAWLTTVVRHQSIDRLRQRTRDAEAAWIAMELVPERPPVSPEDEAVRRAELGEALSRLLSRLSPAERSALVLFEVFGYDHATIAAVLGSSAVNARQHLARARRRLRTEQDPAPDEKRCRELVRRFQAALHAVDLPAMLMLLSDEQPVSVRAAPAVRAAANDAVYRIRLAA